MNIKQKLSLLLILAILYPSGVLAVTRTWDNGGGDGLWGTATNWSGDALPGASDVATFDSTTTTNSLFNVTSTIDGLSIASTYTGTITMATSGLPLLTIGASGFSQAGGTFTMNSGVMQVGGVFSQTGSSILNASGTILLNSTSSQTLTPSSSLPNLIINDGLVGYWKLDDPASLNNSSTTTDSSGYGNTGTATNMGAGSGPSSTVSSQFKFNNPRSFNFDGTNDRVDVSDTSVFNGSAATWSAWVNFGSGISAQETWLMKGTYSSSWSYAFHSNTDNSIRLFIADSPTDAGNNVGDTAAGVVSANTWYHLVVVFNGSGVAAADKLKLYINGANTSMTFSGMNITTLADSTDPLRVGEFTGLGRRLAGLIDDVRVYNRALSATEITDLANGTGPKVASSTIHTLSSTITIDGNFTLAGGLLDASSTGNFGVTVKGDWINYASSSNFTARNGTVTLSGTNQSVSGAGTNFNNLTKSVTSADSLTFDFKSTNNVSGTLTLTGTSGNLLSLRSSSSSGQWKINPLGTRDISFVDVKDSNNINATEINCSNGCVDSGNNTNWLFATAEVLLKYVVKAGNYIFRGGNFIIR